MRITIFDKQDRKAYTIPVNTGSTYNWNLMQEEYISVKFQSNTILKMRKGYWCEIDGLGRFEVVDLPKPEASETADGWDYELRLDRPWYHFKNRIYFYSRSQTNGMEVNWSLTDTIENHAALLVRSINDIGFKYGSETYQVAIAQTIDLEQSKLVQFDKTSILDAITAIAEAFECEWWIDTNVIHFGRCETGEAIELEVGKEIKRPLTRQDDSTEKHGTRLYAFGSSRNLNANYRRELNNPFHIGAVATIYESKVRFATTRPSKWYSEEKKITFTTGRYEGQTVPFEVVGGIYTANIWMNPVFEIDLGLLAGSNGYSGSDKIQFIIGSSEDEQTSQSTCQITSWTRESWQGFTFSDIEIPKMAITNKSRIETNGAQVAFEGMGILYDSDDSPILEGKEIYRRKDKGAVSTGSVTLTHIALAYINRIYTHPIDGDSDIAIQGIAQTTLKLPIGTPYIDSEPNLPEDDITEVVRQYEDIYPRCLLTITEVTEVDATDTDEDTGNVTHWKAYRFKATLQDGTAYTFDKGYIIPDESKPLSIHFESGRLNGMDFEVAFDPEGTGDTRTFEIVRNETYTLQLPNETAKPEVGDTLYMYNMDVTFIDDTLIAAAENELKTRAEKEMLELAKDDGTYTATTNPVLCESKRIDLEYGRMVTLVAPEYFQEKDNYRRTTRVIGWSKSIDDKYQAEYTIGEASAYSPYGALANDIEEIIYINTQNEIAKGGGGGVSNKKTDKKIAEKLSRVNDDTALGHITFNKGLTSKEIAKLLKGAYFGAFAEGLRGGAIDGEGNAELNQLITRAKAILAELKVKGTAEFDGNLFSEEFVSVPHRQRLGNHQGEGQERPRSGGDEIHRRIRQHHREGSITSLHIRNQPAAGRERQPHLHGHARGRPLRRTDGKGLVRYQRRQTLQPVQKGRLHYGAAVQRHAQPREQELHHEALRVHHHGCRHRRHGRRGEPPRLGNLQELRNQQRGHASQPHHQGRHLLPCRQRDGCRPQGHHPDHDRRQRNAIHRYRLRIEDGSGHRTQGTHRKPRGNL